MARQRLKFSDLRRILSRYGVEVVRVTDSHHVFGKQFADGWFTYPVPVHAKDVLECYVQGCRRKFRLTEDDGVSDDEFFSR